MINIKDRNDGESNSTLKLTSGPKTKNKYLMAKKFLNKQETNNQTCFQTTLYNCLYIVFKVLNKIDRSVIIFKDEISEGKTMNNHSNTFNKKEVTKQLEANYSKSTTTEILRLYKTELRK